MRVQYQDRSILDKNGGSSNFSKNSRRLVKRRLVSVSIKNVSSEPKQKLKDDLLIQEEEEVPRILNPSTPNTSSSIASSIKYHAEITPLFSMERFELPKAYFATAQSVHDALIINWNSTYECYERLNAKQAYYLSMEFLQGRAMLNAIGNLELNGAYAEALSKLGHSLENVACQMGNPWEILRNDVSYPVKFYGKVVSGSDGKRHWIGGEDIKAVAYDVPTPRYKTKTTINLRLWSTKAPSEDLDLYAFNVGDHTKAYEALSNAEKICSRSLPWG
ncbi:ALPHA-14 GLUCAN PHOSPHORYLASE L-2 ISOZYME CHLOROPLASTIC/AMYLOPLASTIC [Salix viminalis]|uniref:Alpha-1,4 glucan phosphorylase n=1 Tax=Salix viminalis TaxID=40686 RepID=A0A9Q0NIC8_SALVM|nr:ALPHA-14 GLUCAN PHOSPHORYLASE L-2 ISOZYME CHLOROPLASTIC/AMYLOPLASTIC [Salix viminalis]KAJ6670156.1 ALPHA-14 GLUCAN PHOSPHORYLASE L-2 ISOZYME CHLOROPLASTIC/AMYLOPLASTIC [Salix viminalis]